MAYYKTPLVVKAAKAVTLYDRSSSTNVTYAKDQQLSSAQAKAFPKLGVLISKGILYTAASSGGAVTDIQGRRVKPGKTTMMKPTHVSSSVFKVL
jgi:hypothetical protein